MSADPSLPVPVTPVATGSEAGAVPDETGGAPVLAGPPMLEYHLLARTRTGHRWRMPLALLVAAAVWLGTLTALMALDSRLTLTPLRRVLSLEVSDPVANLGAFLLIALLLPASLLAYRLLGPRPLGLLSSVAGRLRWRWLARSLLVAVAVQLVLLVLDLAVLTPLLRGVPPTVPAVVLQPGAWITLLCALLVVPLQCAGEEYAFRGLPQQLIGGFLRHPAFAVLLPVPFFVLGHGYNVWGQLDVAVAGVVAGYLTWRTGGLEAAIAVHVVNNVSITVMGAVGWVDPTEADGSPLGLAVTLVLSAVTVGWLVRASDRHGVARRRPVAVSA